MSPVAEGNEYEAGDGELAHDAWVFLEELGDDAENLCILVPRKCEVEPLCRVLEGDDPVLRDLAGCFGA